MVNIKVNPRRVELIEKRFILHILLSLAVFYPIVARFAAIAITGSPMGAPAGFLILLPRDIALFFLTAPTISSLLFAALSIYAVILGTLSMEIHSVPRKLVTFPLFLLNLLCTLMYLYGAL